MRLSAEPRLRPLILWLEYMSTATAAMMIRPLIRSWYTDATPRSCSPFVKMPIRSAPNIAPCIVPAPPRSDTPPTTIAASTSFSYPFAWLADACWFMLESTRPDSAPMTPETM
jgi:hypothetical protein